MTVMMMMMRRVVCVLAVVLCCACGYTVAAAAAVDNDSPSGRGVSRGAVEVSCGAGGALRVRPAGESEWLTCGADSSVSACVKYADTCRQRIPRATTRTTIDTTTAGQPKAVMAFIDPFSSSTDIKDIEEIENIGREQAKKPEIATHDNGHPDLGMSNFDMKHFPVVLQSDLENEKKRKAEEIIKKGSYHPGQTDPVNEIYECAKKGLSYGVYGKNCSFMNASDKSVPVDKKPESQVTQNSGNTVTETSDGAADVPPATAVSEGNGSASAATTTTTTTTNTHTESPNATNNSSVPVTDRETTQSAPTVQKKVSGDSSASPVWMRTAAPLLIVAVLVSVAVY